MGVLPSNSLVPEAKLGRHIHCLGDQLVFLSKSIAYRFVLPFGEAADLVFKLKRIVKDMKNKAVILFWFFTWCKCAQDIYMSLVLNLG